MNFALTYSVMRYRWNVEYDRAPIRSCSCRGWWVLKVSHRNSDFIYYSRFILFYLCPVKLDTVTKSSVSYTNNWFTGCFLFPQVD